MSTTDLEVEILSEPNALTFFIQGQNRAPEYTTGLKGPVIYPSGPVDGWGGPPWVRRRSRLQVRLFRRRFWAFFLTVPKLGLVRGLDAAHGVHRPRRTPSVVHGTSVRP